MVILSQIRSFTSSSDLGVASAFAILYMGVVSVSFTRSPMCVCVCVCVCVGGYIVMWKMLAIRILYQVSNTRVIDCE